MPILVKFSELPGGNPLTTPEWINAESLTRGSFGPSGFGGNGVSRFSAQIKRLRDTDGIYLVVPFVMSKRFDIYIDFIESGKKLPFLSLVFENPNSDESYRNDGSIRTEVLAFVFTKIREERKATSPPTNPKHAMNSAQWRELANRLA